MKKLMVTGLCATLLTGCGQAPAEKTQTAAAVEQAVTQKHADKVEKVVTSGITLANIDKSVRPQDNFYQYVNGTWLKNAVIPADRTSVGAFYTLREQSLEDVLKIIEDLSKKQNLKDGSNEQKVAALYRSYMDEEKINQLGITPLKAELATIDAISNKSQVVSHIANGEISGATNPLNFYVSVDAKASSEYRVYLRQSGLSMPGRDYYLKEDDRYKNFRSKFVSHIEKMFALAGFDAPKASAQTILALETQLAKAQWSKVDARNSTKTYNKFAVSDLNQLSDKIDWRAMLDGYGVGSESHVIVAMPSFVKGLGELVANRSIDEWKTYFRWQLLSNRAEHLSAEFVQENFEFFSKTLYGQTELKPRWKRGVDQVSNTLGEIIGEVYVSRHFKPEAKTKMVELVENLRKAYGKGIDELEWMSMSTKIAAKDKLAKFKPKVGYPDEWKDYSKLTISQGDLVGNIISAGIDRHNKAVKKLGGPIDRKEWGMTPQTVNAYYSATKNEIVFPAAILQPPFFNMEADDAVNYGGIGAVIGHEMGHGFDDQGSKYDGDGNMRNWWTDNDLKEFGLRTKALVEQYGNYEVFSDLKLNGELTLGENIGDLAGVTIAYKAYKLSLNGKEAPVIDGLTGDQRFFMGFAQVWQGKRKEESLRNLVETDPHSPGNFRALGSLSNMPEFYMAFDVKEGDKMYIAPEKRVKIW